jgi:predicted SprT family Zn-dependent metalloprotease
LVAEKREGQRNLIINIHQNQNQVVDKVTNMKDTFSKKEYTCKCGTLNERYIWHSEVKTYTLKCNKCSKELDLNNLKSKEVPQTASIRTPTKNR